MLTGRQRAGRTLQQAVDRSNRAAGVGSWAPARVLAWDVWTSGLWHRLLLHGGAEQMLLNRTQERALWVSVIGQDREVSTLRSAASLAGLASEAWAMLARYRGLGRVHGSATNFDTEAFSRWAGEFQERCRERGYLTQARLEGALRQTWKRLPACLPAERELLLVGFDRLLPAQVAMLNDLRETGCVVRQKEEPGLPKNRRLVAAKDEADEVRAAAEWARGLLQERPSARIGVLVPGLKDAPAVRASVERTFREILAPSAQAITAGAEGLPYEFSTGVSMDRTDLGTVALALLDWTQEGLELRRLRALLLSPFFAGSGESSARAEFDAYELGRKTMLRPEVSLDWLVERVEGSGRRARLPRTLACLRRMQAVMQRAFGATERRLYSEWADAMRDLLGAAGWGGDGASDSIGFQTRERWEGLLDELATLDFEGGRVPGGRAIEALHEIAQSTTFAPESREAPVQVMGPEEAAGLRFDAVWFLRAGDLSWPARVAGSALLAWPLRRDLGMPGSDQAADAAQARLVTERIAASSGEIVFSYARQIPEGRQRLSAVLAGLGLPESDAALQPRGMDDLVEIETVEDVARLPLLPERPLHGGAGVLKAQAACAFHAFAEYRLFATEMETRDPGMNASERGIAVHAMLEDFWNEVKTQEALKAMDAAERQERLGRAIDAALAAARREQTLPWDAAYLEAQRRRLSRLGEFWLRLEAARAVPFRVERQESAERDVAIGPLRLSLRLDRVDKTEQGAVLIDYKTGFVGASAWQGERPDEPQLPLYAALAGKMRLHGVAFGMVKPGEGMKLAGYAEGPGILTGRPVTIETGNLEEQVERWRGVLEELARRFVEGDTRVSPKVYPGTCQYCAHRLICRLDVPSLHAEDEEDAGEGMEDERG